MTAVPALSATRVWIPVGTLIMLVFPCLYFSAPLYFILFASEYLPGTCKTRIPHFFISCFSNTSISNYFRSARHSTRTSSSIIVGLDCPSRPLKRGERRKLLKNSTEP